MWLMIDTDSNPNTLFLCDFLQQTAAVNASRLRKKKQSQDEKHGTAHTLAVDTLYWFCSVVNGGWAVLETLD